MIFTVGRAESEREKEFLNMTIGVQYMPARLKVVRELRQ